MTTLRDFISLLQTAEQKLGGDITVILETNLDYFDVDCGIFHAYGVIFDKTAPLYLEVRQAQSDRSVDSPENSTEIQFGFDQWTDGGEYPLLDKKNVLAVSSPTYKYGIKKNDF